MNDRRIAIWRGVIGEPWAVTLDERNCGTPILRGVLVESLGHYSTHAEAIAAARDWIKANPLVIDPKAAA